MRRLIAVNLFVALLAPWMAVVSGTALRVVPCPMHRAGIADHAQNSPMQVGHSGQTKHDASSHSHAARGCNCAGECGRTGAALSLAVAGNDLGRSITAGDSHIAITNRPASVVDRLLPLSTGPPKRLRS